MSSVNFNSSLYSAISKGNTETSFYKSGDGKILYGKPANQNCEKAALAEVIQAFINEKEPTDYKAANNRLRNSYVLNEKIRSHNNNLNWNIFYIFARILSCGYYNQHLEEIDENGGRLQLSQLQVLQTNIDELERALNVKITAKCFNEGIEKSLDDLYFTIQGDLKDSIEEYIEIGSGKLSEPIFKLLILSLIDSSKSGQFSSNDILIDLNKNVHKRLYGVKFTAEAGKYLFIRDVNDSSNQSKTIAKHVKQTITIKNKDLETGKLSTWQMEILLNNYISDKVSE